MRLTSKGRYAVRAMLDLTSHTNGNPVRLQEISTRQGISLHYLEQLFRKLRNGKAVKSVRGPGGGYVLARSMDEISIKDILNCVGENINPARDIVGSDDDSANTVEFGLSKAYFENLGLLMQEYLETTSLGDLIRKAKDATYLKDYRRLNNTADVEKAPGSERPLPGAESKNAVESTFGEINQ